MRYVILFFTLLAVTACTTGPIKTYSVDLPAAGDQQRGQAVVLNALSLIETPYRYGGSHPSTGFDCSGLVMYVYQQANVTGVPRQTTEQAQWGQAVSREQLQAGDLVFFNTLGTANSHVGIYVGQGQFVNAPSSRGRVRIDSMDNPYFKSRFSAARRIF